MAGRDVRAICLDIGERAGWTAGQQFVAVLLAASGAENLFDMPWEIALGTSLGAAIVSVVTTVGQLAIPALKGLGYVGDLVARLAKTFVASFFGALGADKAFNVFDGNLDLAAAANLAAVTTVLALGKGVLARGAVGAAGAATPSTLSNETYTKATG